MLKLLFFCLCAVLPRHNVCRSCSHLTCGSVINSTVEVMHVCCSKPLSRGWCTKVYYLQWSQTELFCLEAFPQTCTYMHVVASIQSVRLTVPVHLPTLLQFANICIRRSVQLSTAVPTSTSRNWSMHKAQQRACFALAMLAKTRHAKTYFGTVQDARQSKGCILYRWVAQVLCRCHNTIRLQQ